MYYAEKEAKKFLEKNNFEIFPSLYAKNENQFKQSVQKLNFPVVLKISGKNIVHKKAIGGVRLNIKNYEQAKEHFEKMKAIKGFQEVIVQKQASGKEILLGIKKTPEFNHVIVFGRGGSDVEKLKDVSFRVAPINKKDAIKMLAETKIYSSLNKNNIELIVKNIMKLNSLIKKFPEISELDINPLMLHDGKAEIIDARILFEK